MYRTMIIYRAIKYLVNYVSTHMLRLYNKVTHQNPFQQTNVIA